jgi:hypothetical protein
MTRALPVLAASLAVACVAVAVAPAEARVKARKLIVHVEGGALGSSTATHSVRVFHDGTYRVVDDGAAPRTGKLTKKRLARLRALLTRAAFTATPLECDAVATDWTRLTAGKRTVTYESPCGSAPDAATLALWRCAEGLAGNPAMAGLSLAEMCPTAP